MANEVAPAFAEVPGCDWKLWIIDEAKNEGGAVYLFRDESSLKQFLDSPLVASVLSNPALENFDLRATDVIPGLSEVTHAPIGTRVTA
jgi:hypothetical protein